MRITIYSDDLNGAVTILTAWLENEDLFCEIENSNDGDIIYCNEGDIEI